jgi:peptidoglycan-associated lipoprotein
MKLRYLSIVAAVAMLAACETPAEQKQTSGGTGGVTTPSGPVAPTAGSIDDFLKNVGDRVFFDYNKSTLRAEGKAALDKQIAWLKQYPAYAITVEGHADERGTREYNLALGERRAAAVKKYMTEKGLPAARVKTITYGKERPVALGSTEAAWSQNRRGVTVLSK